MRIVSAQPGDLDTLKLVAFLVENGGDPYIAVWHSESTHEHFAWSKWTFPRHRIHDIAEVDNRIFVLADPTFEVTITVDGEERMVQQPDATKRQIYAFSGTTAETVGEAGDWVDTDRQSFPIILETPSVESVPLGGESAIVYPTNIFRCHIYGRACGGRAANTRARIRVQSEAGIRDFPVKNLLVGEAKSSADFGKRVIDVGITNLTAQSNYRDPHTIRVEQDNLEPFHLYRLDIECTASAARQK